MISKLLVLLIFFFNCLPSVAKQFPDIAINLGTTATLNHNFNRRPQVLTHAFVCTSADAGYTAGDIIWATNYSGVISGPLFVLDLNPTNIRVIFASTGTIAFPHKTTRVMTIINNANWRLRIFAF